MKRFFCPVALFFLSLFRISGSGTLQTALTSTSRPTPISPDPLDESPFVLVVNKDGIMSLINMESGILLWSYKSGLPTYSSTQASASLDDDDGPSDDSSYIDVGVDGKLYIHDSRRGIKRSLNFGPKDLVSKSPLTINGTTILGQMTTTEIVVDAETGQVIRTLSPFGLESQGKSPRALKKTIARFKETGVILPEPGELVIRRTDYALAAYTQLSDTPLWKLMFSDVEAESISRVLGSLSGSQCHPGQKNKMSSSCWRKIPVYQIREAGNSDPLTVVGAVDRLPYALPSGNENTNTDNQLSILGHERSIVPYGNNEQDGTVSSSVDSISHAIAGMALPSSDKIENSDIQLSIPDHSHSILPHGDIWVDRSSYSISTAIAGLALPATLMWAVALLSGIFFLLVVWAVVYKYYITASANERNEDMKSKAVVTKKKKTRKSGINSNNNKLDKIKVNSTVDGEKGSPGVLPHERGGLLNGSLDMRQIGKLYISYKEIAKGSNGTIVLEGVYDGRPVAVKRLVQTHYDVAMKEIQNLIASDQHPNIVRWYGLEFDNDFVYLALERCFCNLNDWILLHSQTATGIEGMEPGWEEEYIVQLKRRMGNSNNDFKLLRANGYPSAQLLKLMRDVVSGLAHLHYLGIIHRDLKPQNVLIIKEKTFSAKLSDMGISKRLDADMTGLSHHATGSGSSGWQAPEQLKKGRQTRALDMFSLGSFIFFCITGGNHPFGDRLERDSNIVNDKKDLFLVENFPEALDLITHLLDPIPEFRPTAAEVLHHPLFWNSDMRLSFLRDVSDRVELEDREIDSELLKALENVGPVALGGKWDEKLQSSFLTNISRYRKYKYDSVRDLLRVIRNKLNHYRELPLDIQEVLGSVPEGFDNYFTSRFPRLLMEVYRVIYNYCREEELLSKYFKSSQI